MSYWDDFDAQVGNVNLAQDAAEWALTAMACVAYADGEASEEEIERAETLVKNSKIISGVLGPDQGGQFFHQVLMALQVNPSGELEFQKARLADMSGRVTNQEDKDAAFHTLISMATADREISVAEHKMLTELKELIGSNVMVPMPQVQC